MIFFVVVKIYQRYRMGVFVCVCMHLFIYTANIYMNRGWLLLPQKHAVTKLKHFKEVTREDMEPQR